MNIKKPVICFWIFLFLSVQGCDKIPFISKYFPSLKKEEQKASPPPAQVDSTTALPANVLARVGNWTLTLDEFNEKIVILRETIPEFNVDDLESKKLILEELIRQQILIQDAEQSGITRRKDIVDTIDEFRKTLLVREMAIKIAEGIEATDSEVQDYYNQNKEEFVSPVEWHLREIVVPTQEEAKEILIELLKGADFATMAQMRSKGASATNGGDLGFIKELPFPQIKTAVSSLDAGAVSGVFKGPGGYYLVKLEEKKGGVPSAFDEMKEEIKTGLTIMKQQRKILDYIDELKQKTTVITNEDILR